MKREFWLSCLWGAVLGTVLSFACAGCVSTAFDLHVGSTAGLFLVCAGFSVAGAVCFRFKWGGASLLVTLALITGVLLRWGDAAGQILGVVETISRIYNRAYGWGYLILDGSEGAWYPMAAIGVMVALAASGTVSAGKSTWLAVTVVLLPLFLCFVVTDTVPDEGYLFAVMACLGILILTASARAKDSGQGNTLTAMVALPVILALTVLFLLNPQKNYVNQVNSFQQKMELWLEQIPQRIGELPQLWEEMTDGGGVELPRDQTGSVDLRDVGPKKEETYEVMDVTGTFRGTLYLRGQDFDFYSGSGWGSTFRQTEDFPGGGSVLRSTGTVTIETRRMRDILYLPYYPMTGQTLVSGRMYNTEGEKSYTFTVGALMDGGAGSIGSAGTVLTVAQSHGEAEAKELYLNLPEGTKVQAQQLLDAVLTGTQSRKEKANAIARFVRNSARYDLDTRKMPYGEPDFALWFLNESDTGYCVHFATAAAVLLRAADIPARYVTGYLTEIIPGEAVTVTAAEAHAWVEYYEPVLDAWIVLEATPSDATVPETDPATQPEPTQTEAVPTETTGPAPTEGTEQTEQPTEVTESPTEETIPQTPPPKKNLTVPGWLKILMCWILVAAGVVLGVQGQRMLRLERKRRGLKENEPNALALKLWQEAVMLTRLMGKDRPPRELERLAQKAKYSQHTLTDGEIALLEGYLEESRQTLRDHSWYRQLLYRFVYVIY